MKDEGKQRNDFHPAHQPFGQARQRHHVGRAGQQEAARRAVLVHRQLDGRKQVRGFLNFIDHDRASEIADEPRRVAGRQRERRRVVEGEVLRTVLLRQRLGQGCLARLPGAVEQHNRGVSHRLPDGGFNMPPKHGDIFTGSW